MRAKYRIGQKVRIIPVGERLLLRDNALDTYAGQIGEVVNYYWISPRDGNVFYIYTVRTGAGRKELVLHEDEIEAH